VSEEVAGPLPLARNRDFRLLWVGQALSVLGSRIAWVAYPLLVLGLTGSAAKAGLVGFATWLPIFLFGLPAGAVVDRVDRKRLMVACECGRALAVATIPATLALGVLTFPQIIAVAFIERTLATFFEPAETAAVRNLVPQPQLGEAIARNESREYAAFLLGPLAGGALFTLGRGLPFVADAISYTASAVSLFLIRRPLQQSYEAEATPPWLAGIGDGVRFVWRQPFLRTTALISAGANFVTNGAGLAAIIVARQTLDASGAAIGLMLTIGGLGGLIGSLAAPRLQAWLSPRQVIAIGAYAWAVAIPAMLSAPNAYALGALLGVALFTAPPWNAVIGAYRIALTPDRLQGRVQSVTSVSTQGAIAFGNLAAGVLLEVVGRGTTFIAFGAIMALVGAIGTLSAAARETLSRAARSTPIASV
jgi:MFS family permease